MSASFDLLVVDDTPTNLEVVTEILTEAGYNVAVATNGERALKHLNTYAVDLILLDVMMPGIDGFEVCKRLKAEPKSVRIPVIFMTALNDTGSKVKGFELGAADYITKPFQEQELLARVKTHLSLYQWHQALEGQVRDRTQVLEATFEQLKQSQLQLVQSEKMSALGNLVAGVAHEINNPLSFLKGNIPSARAYVQDLFQLIETLLAKCPTDDPEIEAEIEAMDLIFVREDLPKLFDSMSTGVDWLRDLSNSLRCFSRQDRDFKTTADVHEGLDSTLMILRHRIKGNEERPEIQIQKQYSELPEILCFPGQLNQVFMNILANAIDALDEANRDKRYAEIEAAPNAIAIRTSANRDQVKIQIQDNGIGMNSEVQELIFEQGFTTKAVGKGTGLGMAIAYRIVTEKHGGSITCTSEIGRGTTFTIFLPLSA